MSQSSSLNNALDPPPNSPTKRITLIDRQANEKGDAPMLATLRISELDKLVARLKQRHAYCVDAIDAYAKEIAFIDKETKNIMDRYVPLCKRLTDRQQERDRLHHQHDQVASQVGEILSSTKTRLRLASHDHLRTIRHEAREELRGARGYSLGQESTMYQHKSPRHLPQTAALTKASSSSSSGRN